MIEQKKAVALKYPDGAGAPLIAASAKGFLAQKLLELAAEFLTVQEIGAAIPEETWEALAKIFAFVLSVERKNGNVKKV